MSNSAPEHIWIAEAYRSRPASGARVALATSSTPHPGATQYTRTDIARADTLLVQTEAIAEIERLRALLRRALRDDAEWREDVGEHLDG